MPSTNNISAEDYLREFASSTTEAWIKLLIEKVINTQEVADKSFLDNVYQIFLEENKLKANEKKTTSTLITPAYNSVANGNSQNTHSFKLKNLIHENGVNALVEGATLSFHPQLTVIYGKNGSGKSGFARIIKKISGSRTQEEIWQNIHKSKTQNKCKVKISYENDGTDHLFDWDGANKISPFDRLNVFDGKCIPIYLTKSLNFSYQPYGFQLFQILSKALLEIHERFQADIAKRESSKPSLGNLFDDETIIGKFISSISEKTEIATLNKLPKWDSKAKRELTAKEKELRGLNSLDEQLELLENRVQKLTTLQIKLEEIQKEFSSQNINAYLKLVKNFNLLKKKFATKKGKTLEDYKIPEMESDEWHNFIEAGEEYIRASHQDHYPTEDSYCIYCRQKLTRTAIILIKLYSTLFKEDDSSKFEDAEEELNNALDELKNISFSDDFIYKKSDFEKILPFKTINSAYKSLEDADKLIENIIDCLNEKKTQKIKSLKLHNLIERIENKQDKIRVEIGEVEELQKNLSQHSKELERQIAELQDTQKYSKHRQNIEKYIIYTQWVAKAQSILNKLNTKPITELGTKAWKELVSDSFKKQFEKEVESLNAPAVNLEFRGEYGSQMREKSLEGLTRIDDFLSEGEQKAVALSDFFAELSMNSKKAPVVFDDPATSFDHERKEMFAKRIVEESKSTQIIVFTHDLMFASNIHDLVLNTQNIIDKDKAAFHDLNSEGGNVGIVTENYYQGSAKLDSYIPRIQAKITTTEQLTGEEKTDAIRTVYSMLRKAVEKVVEERIFGGIIIRWSDRIQLLSEPRATLDRTKLQKAKDYHGEFSRYIEAHNQSNAMIQHSLPNIDKLKADFRNIQDLANKVG